MPLPPSRPGRFAPAIGPLRVSRLDVFKVALFRQRCVALSRQRLDVLSCCQRRLDGLDGFGVADFPTSAISQLCTSTLANSATFALGLRGFGKPWSSCLSLRSERDEMIFSFIRSFAR